MPTNNDGTKKWVKEGDKNTNLFLGGAKKGENQLNSLMVT